MRKKKANINMKEGEIQLQKWKILTNKIGKLVLLVWVGLRRVAKKRMQTI